MPDTAFYTKLKVGTRRRSLSHGAPGMRAGGSSEQNEDFAHEPLTSQLMGSEAPQPQSRKLQIAAPAATDQAPERSHGRGTRGLRSMES